MTESTETHLGGHLRRLRKNCDLSLGEVQVWTNGDFKASILGAYERGERSILHRRLVQLFRFYQAHTAPDRIHWDSFGQWIAHVLEEELPTRDITVQGEPVTMTITTEGQYMRLEGSAVILGQQSLFAGETVA